MHGIWRSATAEISKKYSPKMTQMLSMLHNHKVIMIFDDSSVLDTSIPCNLSLDMVQGHLNLEQKVDFVVVLFRFNMAYVCGIRR
jgi:hypothetical protein